MNPSPKAELADVPDQSPHYVQAVTELGEERDVIAQEDIYSANGMKLVAKGAKLNNSLRERLNLHKLQMPLDFLLTTQDAVDAGQLAIDGSKLLAEDLSMLRLAERSGDPLGFKQCLGMLMLPAPLRFRLTVMKQRRFPLYQHSLRVALIAYAAAVVMRMPARQKQELLLAAICHDLGEMHTDPLLLAASHQMTPEERGYIHVHPITSYVLLRDMQGIPAATLQAVLHHHERLDGSGYPYGLASDKISQFARMLCVAEVMEGIGRRSEWHRLDVLLRLNHRRLDQEVVEAVRELIQADTGDYAENSAEDTVVLKLTHLRAVLHAWQSMQAGAGQQEPSASDLQFLGERMTMLRSLILQAGIDPDNFTSLLEIARGEPEVSAELQATLNELVWLTSDIANEIDRRTATLSLQSKTAVAEFFHTLRVKPALNNNE